MYTLPLLFAMAVTVGAATDTWSNVTAMGGGNDVRAYVAVVSIMSVFAGFSAPVAFQINKLGGSLLFIGWICSLAFTLGASIDRVSGAKHAKVHASASDNARINDLKSQIKDYRFKADWESAGRPMKDGKPDLAGKRTSRPVCGTNCKGWIAKADVADAELRRLGVTKETDSGAASVSFLTGGMIKKQDWSIIHPALGPITLILFINGFSIVLGSMYCGHRHNVSRETKRLEAAPTKAEVAENVYSFAQRFEQKNRRKMTLPEGEAAFPDIPRTSVYRYMNGDIPGKKPRKPRATRKLVAAG